MIDRIPHIEQYDGLWLMHGQTLQDRLSQINAMDLASHVEARLGGMDARSGADDDRYEMVGSGIAVVSIEGAMTKYGSSLSRADSTVELRRSIRAAAADTEVRGILLRVDTPGGMVAGTSDLADDLAAARKAKPVHAYIEDMGASAGYWVASQAARITVNRTAVVGSIGTYAYLLDYSGAFAEPGNGTGAIKTIEIKSTTLKGTGIAPGAEISDAQIANLQRELNEINDEFKAAVQRGRGFSAEQIDELADARVHIGQKAVVLGLADAVGTMDQAIESLSEEINGARRVRHSAFINPISQKSALMAQNKSGLVKPFANEDELKDETSEDVESEEDETTTTEDGDEEVMEDDDSDEGEEQASVLELKAAIPDSDAEFREQCIERGYSIAQAKDAWMDTLRARLQNREEALSQSKTPRGVKRLVSSKPRKASTATSAIDQVNELRQKYVSSGLSRSEAHKRVMRENPELRKALVAEANS